MVKYYGKKFLSMCITLLVVSFFVFAAFEIIPGDAVVSQLGTNATQEKVEQLREEMGLNRPFMVRYGEWVWNFVRGDLGESYSYHMPVSSMILEKIPITMTMSVMALILTMVCSVPIGVFLAKHTGSCADKIGYAANQMIMAVPAFFLGILFTYLFGLILKWFRPGGYVSYTKDFWGFFKYMIMPSIAIAIPKCAMSVKLIRSSILTESKKDYVRTAYSRGNSTTQVLYRHVLKNAMLPVVTFWGMAFTDMIASSIVVEQVFNIPGLGRILLTSISNRDFPVVEAVILLIAVLVLVTNFLVDILYRILDSRI